MFTSKNLNFVREDRLINSITGKVGSTTRFNHDNAGNLIEITDPDNLSRTFTYRADHALLTQVDKAGRGSGYRYDNHGALINAIRPDNSIIEIKSQNTQLLGEKKGTMDDPFNLATETRRPNIIKDAKGNATEFYTNDFGAVTRVVDALTGETRIERDDNNNITRRVDELGREALFTYDEYGNVLTRRERFGRTFNRITTYEYEEDPTENFHQPIVVTDAKGNKTRYSYDTRGNQLEVRSADGNSSQSTYNSWGQTLTQQNPFTLTGRIYEYDSRGNVEIVRNLGQKVLGSFTYDNRDNILTSTDSLNNTTILTYDSMNRVLTQTDAKGSIIQFTYDGEGNRTSLTDGEGKTTRFVYDGEDRQIERIDPLGNSDYYIYDDNGNLSIRVDRKGNRILYTHDKLDRLERITYPNREEVTFAYDATGNILTAEDSDSKIAYTYDGFDRVKTISTRGSLSQPSINLTYEYDTNDNVISLQDSQMGVLEKLIYDYDKVNRLTSISRGTDSDPYKIRRRYNIPQRKIETLFPNGVKTTYNYELGNDFRMREVTHEKGGTIFSSSAYTYNLNDNVTKTNTTRTGITISEDLSYTYDPIDQLISATKPTETGSQTFIYDRNGNRIRKDNEQTDSTFNDNNQLINDKTYTYTYDRNGNLTTKTNITTGEITENTWDFENRLTQTLIKPNQNAQPTTTVTYKYDAYGRRIEKNVNNSIIRYIYDRGNIYLEFDGDNAFKARYIHGGFEQPLIMEREDSPYQNPSFARQEFYYHTDRLGSITDITDFNGIVVQRYVYDAFGNIQIFDKDNTPITHTSSTYLKNPHTFTGQEYNPTTNNYNLGARVYDPTTGRFPSEDPIGFAGLDANLYGYVFNNSINQVDPNGEIGFVPAIALAAAAGGVGGALGTYVVGGDYCAVLESFLLGAAGGIATTFIVLTSAILAGGGAITLATPLAASAFGLTFGVPVGVLAIGAATVADVIRPVLSLCEDLCKDN